MKSLMLLILLALAPVVSNASDASVFLHEEDKQKHMALSALGANLLHAAGMTEKQAFWTMIAIGLSKEVLLDPHNSKQEHRRDMLANTIGAGTVFVWSIKF